MLRHVRKIINVTIWVIVAVCLLTVILLNIPSVQTYIGQRVAAVLAEQIGTEVSVGRVDIGLLRRAIIDDVYVSDEAGRPLLTAQRLSATVRLRDLLRGKITISSAQVFSLKAQLCKDIGAERTNFQFLLDAFSSDDDSGEQKPIDLRVNSLIIRRSAIVYNDLNDTREGLLSPQHVNLHDISAHIIANKIADDSLNVHVLRLSLRDASGLDIQRLSFKFIAGTTGATLSDFSLRLPISQLHINASATYTLLRDTTTHLSNLHYSATIDDSALLLSELHLLPSHEGLTDVPIDISAAAEGDDNSARLLSLSLAQGDDFLLHSSATAIREDSLWRWTLSLDDMRTNVSGIESVIGSVGIVPSLPSFTEHIKRATLVAEATGYGDDLSLSAHLTSSLGDVDIEAEKNGTAVAGTLTADSVALALLANSTTFGSCSLATTFSAQVRDKELLACSATATLPVFTYCDHTYRDATVSLSYADDKTLSVAAAVADEYGAVSLAVESKDFLLLYLSGENLSSPRMKIPLTDFALTADSLDPAALHLTDRWEGSTLSGTLKGFVACEGIDNVKGSLYVENLRRQYASDAYTCRQLLVDIICNDEGAKRLTCQSDFANIVVEGTFHYATLFDTFTAALATRLPALPLGGQPAPQDNNIAIYASVNSTDFVEHILGVPLLLTEPAHLVAKFDDTTRTASISADAYSFAYDGRQYTDGYVIVNAVSDTLRAKVNALSADDSGNSLQVTVSAKGYDNYLSSSVLFDSNGRNHISGSIATLLDLNNTTPAGAPVYEVSVLPSSVLVADTTWVVNPSHITYYDNYLRVDNFTIGHGDQYVNINGVAQREGGDSILVDLKDVNVAYILDFVNFHSVDFDGYATGRAMLVSLFDKPYLGADLSVRAFRFEGGDMGTANIAVSYDFDIGNINIDALLREEEWCSTSVNGYVSPKNDNIDLTITAQGSNLKFIETYCTDFATIPQAQGWGMINVVGPLKEINILGSALVTGDLLVTAINVPYHLERQRVQFAENDIVFAADTLVDCRGNKGVLTGHLPHDHLSNISFDFTVEAANLLALDLQDFGEDTYLGTVYATGTCHIAEVNGGTVITADVVPEDGSFLTYNATAPDRVSDSFVHWRDGDALPAADDEAYGDEAASDEALLSDLYINLLVRCEKNAELRVLMDARTGDLITLHGSGVITASFYNKGTFSLYGNYVVDNGTYRMTIQDVIKRDFTFKEGGTISFAGDASQAQLNMQADYSLASVPLSDINIGNMFSNSNVRVDCIMNITGTPDNPQVDFSLDMPTIGADAKQMIMSMFNDNEELNQQVVYLIAVGRFLNQGTSTSSSSARYSQTSLAMQSILSGTVSQQINSLLENVIGSKQWDFGANISPGEEGFNDAEYEGLISGRMLNDRLLFNGQFGYRDNANATSSFIGDFDLRYLLTATGSLSVRIYNETNNRYFTKNTLNTQGVSLIVKKDFSSWRDFWRRKKKTNIEAPTDSLPADSLPTTPL